MRGWRAFAEVNGHLLAALEADLAPHGLTLGDYEVLVILSESCRPPAADVRPGRARSACRPSGLTRRLDGLVKAGYVQRVAVEQRPAGDARHHHRRGLDAMSTAAGDHVASVRRHLIDLLTAEQIDALGDIFLAVGAGLGRATTSRRHRLSRPA